MIDPHLLIAPGWQKRPGRPPIYLHLHWCTPLGGTSVGVHTDLPLPI